MDVKVDRSEQGWEVAVVPVKLTAKGKELFGIEEMVRSSYGPKRRCHR